MITTHFALFSFFDGMSLGVQPPPPEPAQAAPYGAPAWDYLKRLHAWRAARFLTSRYEILEELKERVEESQTRREEVKAKSEHEEVARFLASLERASDQDAFLDQHMRMTNKLVALCEMVEEIEAEIEDEEEIAIVIRALQ